MHPVGCLVFAVRVLRYSFWVFVTGGRAGKRTAAARGDPVNRARETGSRRGAGRAECEDPCPQAEEVRVTDPLKVPEHFLSESKQSK